MATKKVPDAIAQTDTLLSMSQSTLLELRSHLHRRLRDLETSLQNRSP